MILHLMEDEKFTDTIIDQFESVAPNKSVYFIAVENLHSPLRYVKSKNENIIIDRVNSPAFAEIKVQLENYNVVVLHNLINPYRKDIVNEASKGVRFHWMVWGYDYYNLITDEKKFLSQQSRQYIKMNKNINWYIGKFIINHLSLFDFVLKEKAKSFRNKDFKKLFNKIESFSTVIPNEAAIINQSLSKKLHYIPLKYGYLENLILTDERLICDEGNFFVGNSATPSNNHLEVLDNIIKYKKNQKLYIPISYGDNNYAQYIKKRYDHLENDIYFMEDFIDIKSYNKILLKCGNVIMNHYRQQAMGNIIIALYNGARVFLNKKSPVYDYLNDLGITFFDVEKDLQRLDLLPSFSELAKHNRPILKNIYAKELVLKETEEFVQYFSN